MGPIASDTLPVIFLVCYTAWLVVIWAAKVCCGEMPRRLRAATPASNFSLLFKSILISLIMLFICFLGLNHLWLQNYDFFSKMSVLILLIADTFLLFSIFDAKKVKKVRIWDDNANFFLNVYSLVDLGKWMINVCVCVIIYNNVHVHFIIYWSLQILSCNLCLMVKYWFFFCFAVIVRLLSKKVQGLFRK